MLLHLVTIISLLIPTLPLGIDVVLCDETNATRARRTASDRFAWVMDGAAESLDWVLSSGEGEDEHEDSEFTSSLANDDTIFIGDMAFLKQDLSSDIQTDGSVQYSMVRDKRKIWTDGEMPLKVHHSIGRRVRGTIQEAIKTIVDNTCIRIVPYEASRHHNYVHVVSYKQDCSSFLGRVGNGAQELNLAPHPHCHTKRTIMHEMLHALGVYHEQQRYDRDNYIEVLEHNLVPDALSEYKKASPAQMTTLGLPYDYASIMHYSVYQGSKRENLPAFRVLGTFDESRIGKMPSLSQLDIRKLNKLYGCQRTPDGDDGNGGDDGDDDGPIIPKPTFRPPTPIDDGEVNTGSNCNFGCCVTCDCNRAFCNCKSNCNCHCTCFPAINHCNCNCNPPIYVTGLAASQPVPQHNIIYSK